MEATKSGGGTVGFLARIGAGFRRTGEFFGDVMSELKKVRWPNRKELTSYTIQAGDAGTLIPSRAEATGLDGPNEVRAVANDDVWVPDAPVPVEDGDGSFAGGDSVGSDQPAMVLAANQGQATAETIGRFDRDPYLDTFLVVLGIGVIGGLVALGMAKRHYRSHPA